MEDKAEHVSLTQLFEIPTQSLFNTTVKEESSKRFEDPLDDSAFNANIASRIPAHTQSSTKWACNVFSEWRTWRNFRRVTMEDRKWPIPTLQDGDLESLDYWLSRFITEIKRQDGTPYPPGSLTNLAAGIQRYMRNECDRRDVWLLKKDDPHFKGFREALDTRRKSLFKVGIGTTPVRADPVTKNDEEQLWESGVLNMSTSAGLSYATYFYNEKIFGFRARDEHDGLMAEQYSFGEEDGRRYVQYNGRLAKNITGSLSSKSVPRQVRHYADPGNERCVVSLFETYLSHVPPIGRFYRRPILRKDGIIAFSSQPVGLNTLSGYLPKMFKEAGIDTQGRNITGHSGKVTCCSELYKAGFDEQTIKKRSGHTSSAVQLYKRPSLELEQRVSDALQPPRPKSAPAASCSSSSSSSTLDTEKFQKNATSSPPSCNDDKETLTIHVPSQIKKIVIVKEGKKFTLEV